MLSQLDLLKRSLERLEQQFPGQDSPFKQGLKAQIARHEKPPAENPVETFSVGMRGPAPKA